MFSIPLMSAVQLPSLFGETLTIPGAGALLAAVLIAALVGSALGLLRQATGPHADTTTRRPVTVPPPLDHREPYAHRKAA